VPIHVRSEIISSFKRDGEYESPMAAGALSGRKRGGGMILS
jgi:hypothetical protein